MFNRIKFVLLFLLFALSVFSSSLKVVSLSPALTEIVCFIGADSMLVGVSSYCNYPPYVDTLPKVGGFNRPSIEKLLKLHPDIVLMMEDNSSIPEELKSYGMDVFTFTIEDINDLKIAIEDIGLILNTDVSKAIDSVEYLYSKNENILLDSTFIVEISPSPVYVSGDMSFINKMLVHGGMKPSLSLPFKYGVITLDQFLTNKPSYLIVAHEGISPYDGEDGVNIIYLKEYDRDILLRPGPRMVTIPSVIKKYME